MRHSSSTGRAFRCTAILLTAISAVSVAGLAHADTRTYTHRAADGSITFSDVPMDNGVLGRRSYSNFTKPASVVNPCRGLSTRDLAERGNRLDDHFIAAARQFQIDAALIKAVARAESCFDPDAISAAGAKGLMQLMPATAAQMGVKRIHDAKDNLFGGADYLARMLKRYNNNLDLALAAYNAGPGNVDKYNGVPPFRETQRYIRSVKAFKNRFSQEPTS